LAHAKGRRFAAMGDARPKIWEWRRVGEFFDHIVAGAGSAGCVLANRLSQDPGKRVLVLEAGSTDNWIWFHIPVGYLFAIGNPRADWLFKTEPEAGLNGRVLNYPRGKVIGGSSAINAMIYMRGQSQDYDRWRQAGLTGWGWDDVLPYFLKHENHVAPPNRHHSSGGEWSVDFPRMRWEILDAVQAAAGQIGIAKVDDFNSGSNEGTSYFQVNQRNGRRWSAARGFLTPVLKRPNLNLVTQATVRRVLIEEGRATGVEYEVKGKIVVAKAGEVILSSGAIGSPHILHMSGIGPGAMLREAGIPVAIDLPGVGANLQDHLQIRPIYKISGAKSLNVEYRNYVKRLGMVAQYAAFRTGPMTMAPSQLGIFARSDSRYETPNLQFHVQPLSLDKFGESMHAFPAVTVSVCNLRPTSRGVVRTRSAEPHQAPAIAPNYLSTEEDRRVAVESLKLVRRLMSQPALARFRPEEYRPGRQAESDAELLAAAADLGTTIFHPVGTARMGVAGDVGAVLDERLRVRGVDRLRVIDASAMPSITSGNTNSPTIMIAEKGAEMVLADRR
jgi:choline dehydrogenase